MSNTSIDAGIPLLTEIITEPSSLSVQAETAPTASAREREKEREKEDIASLQRQAVQEWDEEHWNRLEREIRERVLYQVLERIDLVLEQRVRDSLADVLQIAIEGLTSEIKNGLRYTMSDVITRAVAQEISKLQAAKK